MKNELRKTVLPQLTSQEPETKAKIDKHLLEQLIALPAYKEAQVIATYLSFPHEYEDRKSTRLNSSHSAKSRMPSSA